MKIKAGIGYDIHRLERGRRLFLGGVEVDFPKGLKGHSDGDCLVHAMIDALLGSVGEKDIGQIFPDSEPRYKNIRSTELLKDVVDRLRKKNVEIVNVDSVIVAEAPQLAPHIPRMKDVLCPILGIGSASLGIKAKTNEGLGDIGQGKAIAAWVQALVREKSEG